MTTHNDVLRLVRTEILDPEALEAVSVAGHGGGEVKIAAALRGARRTVGRADASLWDYEVPSSVGTIRIEVKKQEVHQWFDVGKYHKLTAAERDIVMLFVMHEKGRITKVLGSTLGAFLEAALTDEECKELGWTSEVIASAHALKAKYPALQFKVKARPLGMAGRRPDVVARLYP